MGMRPLTKEEKEVTLKNIIRRKKELERLDFLEEHANLMLEKGLQANYDTQEEEYKQKLKAVKAEKEETEFTIAVSEKQIVEGVEEKEEGEAE